MHLIILEGRFQSAFAYIQNNRIYTEQHVSGPCLQKPYINKRYLTHENDSLYTIKSHEE